MVSFQKLDAAMKCIKRKWLDEPFHKTDEDGQERCHQKTWKRMQDNWREENMLLTERPMQMRLERHPGPTEAASPRRAATPEWKDGELIAGGERESEHLESERLDVMGSLFQRGNLVDEVQMKLT
jgi:hypothetical protein